MKPLLLTILFIALLGTGRGQKVDFRPLKQQILPVSLVILAGAMDGLCETVSHNYAGFKKAFPNSNDYYWSPSISFTRKYKNGKREDGERFLGSTTVFVAATDSYHGLRFLNHLFMAGTIAVKIGQAKKRWWVYCIETASYWIIERVSFSLVFNSFKH